MPSTSRRTPVFDDLVARYPSTELRASGPAVGLPEGQMGNSEVGHLTIGSGRILFQDLVRVNRAVEDGSLFANEALLGAFRRAKERTATCTCSGSSPRAASTRTSPTYGRCSSSPAGGDGGTDVDPRLHRRTRRLAARRVQTTWPTLPPDRIATVVGPLLRDGPRQALGPDRPRPRRRWSAASARRRTTRWPPCARATSGRDRRVRRAGRARAAGRGSIPAKDAAIVFNFRPDRARQLTQRLLEARRRRRRR